jgi:hypothetical protein
VILAERPALFSGVARDLKFARFFRFTVAMRLTRRMA